MASQPAVHFGENSPEQVAFNLMHTIANAEGMTFSPHASGKVATREWIIRTYTQCLYAVQNPGPAYVNDVLEMSP